jgi:ornithine cyclodeaminase/alanine dehydrogenase-like protein (mu-crystallin family)
VFPLTRIELWGRNPDTTGKLATRLARQGLPAHVVTEPLDDAIARASIVSVATLATEPVVRGALLQRGSHLDLIGSFTPQMREADDDAFRDAAIYVDTEEALAKSGDLLGPLSRGVFQQAEVATLADLCREARPGRTHPTQRTVFKSAGTALEDLTAAILVYEGVQTR